MSGDELLLLVASLGITVWRWPRWYARALLPPQLIGNRRARWPLTLVPLYCAAVLTFILLAWSASDVRSSPLYLLQYLAMGSAWVAAALISLPAFGLSPHEDVVERGNRAAGWATAGALLGLTLAYAGGNLGEGPGWPVVAFSAGLSTLGLLAAWVLLNAFGGVTPCVTVERDTACGIRLGAFLLAVGAVLGRAVAGNWVSVPATLRDFGQAGWPVLLLVLAELALGRAVRPTPNQPTLPLVSAGVLPSLAYIGVSAAYIAWLGWWT
jgi:hypothetical protein